MKKSTDQSNPHSNGARSIETIREEWDSATSLFDSGSYSDGLRRLETLKTEIGKLENGQARSDKFHYEYDFLKRQYVAAASNKDQDKLLELVTKFEDLQSSPEYSSQLHQFSIQLLLGNIHEHIGNKDLALDYYLIAADKIDDQIPPYNRLISIKFLNRAIHLSNERDDVAPEDASEIAFDLLGKIVYIVNSSTTAEQESHEKKEGAKEREEPTDELDSVIVDSLVRSLSASVRHAREYQYNDFANLLAGTIVRINERHSGPNSDSTVRAKMLLSETFEDQGKWGLALEVLEQVDTSAESIVAESKKCRFYALQAIADISRQSGELEESLETYEFLLEVEKGREDTDAYSICVLAGNALECAAKLGNDLKVLDFAKLCWESIALVKDDEALVDTAPTSVLEMVANYFDGTEELLGVMLDLHRMAIHRLSEEYHDKVISATCYLSYAEALHVAALSNVSEESFANREEFGELGKEFDVALGMAASYTVQFEQSMPEQHAWYAKDNYLNIHLLSAEFSLLRGQLKDGLDQLEEAKKLGLEQNDWRAFVRIARVLKCTGEKVMESGQTLEGVDSAYTLYEDAAFFLTKAFNEIDYTDPAINNVYSILYDSAAELLSLADALSTEAMKALEEAFNQSKPPESLSEENSWSDITPASFDFFYETRPQ